MAYGYDDRPQYISLMDMIDGGGAGRSGDRFEGGGLLSLLANELFRPRGYEDRLRQRKNDTGRAVSTVVDELMRERAAMKEMERQRGLQQDRFDTRDQQGATDFRPPVKARELTGSADMPPELLPMTTLSEGSARRGTLGDDAIQNSAFQQLFNRSVAEGYRGADMPSYIAEKKLIEMAKYPNSEYSHNMSEADYASLMPPSLMRQAAGTPTAPTASIVPEVPVEPAPMRQPATGMTYNLMEGQEFADFMKLQRDLEQEMGLEPMTVESIHNMFKTWKSRGY